MAEGKKEVSNFSDKLIKLLIINEFKNLVDNYEEAVDDINFKVYK